MKRLALVVLAGLTGCTVTNYTNARTLGRGQLEVIAEPSFVQETGGAEPGGSLAVSGRLGVTDRLDLGLRLSPFTAGALGKVALTDADAGRIDVALAPSVNTAWDAELSPQLLQLSLPVLVGVDFRERDQLVFGAGAAQLLFREDPNRFTFSGSVGYQLWLGDVVALQPEVGALIPVSAALPVLFQAGVGVQLGSRGRR